MKNSSIFPPVFEDLLIGLPESEIETSGRELSDVRADELKINSIKGAYDLEHISKIHEHLFQDSSTHAGVVRDYGMSKGASSFATPAQMPYLFKKELPERITALAQSVNNQEKYINGLADLHTTLDLAHPFREGNGRSTRTFMSQLTKKHGYTLDFSKVDQKEWVGSCIHSINKADEILKRPLFEKMAVPTHERLVAMGKSIRRVGKNNVKQFKQMAMDDVSKGDDFEL